MASISETRIVDEIPDTMKKLASFIARGFYSKEHGIVVDMLKRFVCMKEDQLKDLSKIDIKQLRSILIALKQDKLIKERQLTEERTQSNRPIKINYYFINYRALLNVTKYKIDHMRRKLESEEMTNTHRASYKCSRCQKPYTDLDVGTLWDMESMLMLCLFCRGPVEEDETAGPSQDTRSLLAKFNEQMAPLFLILQELDGVQLAPHLLEPTPSADKETDVLNPAGSSVPGLGGRSYQRHQFSFYQQQDFTVNIEGTAGATNTKDFTPEQPLWLRDTTIPTTAGLTAEESSLKMEQGEVVKHEPESPTKEMAHSEIVQTLLAHEMKTETGSEKGAETLETPVKQEIKENSSSDSEFEDVEDDEGRATVFVEVQGVKHELHEVSINPVLVEQMTAEEKGAYIRISQQHFDD